MTWVKGVPKIGQAKATATFDVYYKVKDGRTLRWYGGTTEAKAYEEAHRVLGQDAHTNLYGFVSAVIVKTESVDTVTEHLEVVR